MNYRREIDGLRALAVIPVILFHAGFQAFGGGFVGVDVFFVISGYLITSIILAEKQAGAFSLIRFYERRARRILPALFVVMFACLPFAWLWLLPSDMKDFSQSLVAVSGFASNILFYWKSGYFDTAAELQPLLHTWSLAVEEQYYLLFPIFFLLTWRLGKRWIVGILAVMALISLAAAQWGSLTYPRFTFFLLPTRGWAILVGAFVAFYLFAKENDKSKTTKTGQSASVIGLLLITYAVWAFGKQTPYPSLYALIPTIGTAFIILFATQQTMIGKLLGSKLLVGVGLISYSAYLWHQPLFAFARHRSIDQPGKVMLAALAVAALPLAYLSWRFVETPFRNRQRIKRNQVFGIGALCSFVFVVIGLVGHFTGGYGNRFPDEILPVMHEATNNNPRERECFSDPKQFINPADSCVYGDKSNPRFVLLGDSHANAIAYELGKSFQDRGLGFTQMTYTGCPPVLDIYMPRLGQEHKCYEFNQSVYKFIKQQDGAEYIILMAYWKYYLEPMLDNDQGGVTFTPNQANIKSHKDNPLSDLDNERVSLVLKKYKESIVTLLNQNKKVILVYPVPEVGRNLPEYLTKVYIFNGVRIYNFTTDYNLYLKRNRLVLDTFDGLGERRNLIRIRSDLLFCDVGIKNRCATQFNGVPMYFDASHLSNTGARLVVDEIMKHISKQQS